MLYISISLLFMAKKYFLVWICVIWFIPIPASEHSACCFHFLTSMNKAATDDKQLSTILHFYQQSMKVPFSLYPDQHLFSVLCFLFNYRNSNECEVESHFSFNLHVADDESFHVLLGHLYFYLGEMSVQIFCPFLIG